MKPPSALRKSTPPPSFELPQKADLHGYVDHAFGPDGPFAKRFQGYQTRHGQVEFAHAVADAVKDNVIVLAEAGTGVGKSYASLVPAVKSVIEDGGKLVYVTANIALQEQLIDKDLPNLQKITGLTFSYALAKGFSNYVCQRKRDDSDSERLTGKLHLPVVKDQHAFEKIVAWKSATGDLSDLDFEPSSFVKSLVTTSSDECIGKKCEYFDNGCFPRAARKRVEKSQVVVTNYHLYFLDLELRRAAGRGLLPPHRILVMDEFHAAPAIARSFLGRRMSEGAVKNAVADLDARGPRAERLKLPKALSPEIKHEVEKEAEPFFQELVNLASNRDLYTARLKLPGQIQGDLLERALKQASKCYFDASTEYGLEAEARAWLTNRSALCSKHAGLIEAARALEQKDQIFYIDLEDVNQRQGAFFHKNKRATLVQEPLFPSDTLREELFEHDSEPRAIICQSATLTTSSSKPFAYIAKQAGINKYDECVAESPFDYKKCCFVVPAGMPDPQHRDFADAVGQVLRQLTELTGGRTLGLFTSYRVMDVAWNALQGSPFTVLKQGTAPRSQIIRQFKEDHSSVLLGTESFWAGVDVPGDALVAVFIDKIPFDHFDDPVLDAVKDSDKNWFQSYYKPKAVIQFKQGFGRLIRSVTDHGAVVCCDNRITDKPYGKSFLRALPVDVEIYDRIEKVVPYCKIG